MLIPQWGRNETKKTEGPPPKAEPIVERKVTDTQDLAKLDAMAVDPQGPRYILVREAPAPAKKGFFSSFWGRALKTIAGVAIAGAIAAAAFFGVARMGAPVGPDPLGPVAPVERVETRTPSLPGGNPTDSTSIETRSPTLPGQNTSSGPNGTITIHPRGIQLPPSPHTP